MDFPDAVLEFGEDQALEGHLHGLDGAGQTKDEGLPRDPTRGPTHERGRPHLLEAQMTEELAKATEILIEERGHCFDGEIPAAEPGPSCGEDTPHLALHQVHALLLNGSEVIFQQPVPDQPMSILLHAILDILPRLIPGLIPTVADGDHSEGDLSDSLGGLPVLFDTHEVSRDSALHAS